MAPNCMTEIVNNTEQVLDMKVANSVYVVDLARLGRGAKHFVPVDNTDTYEEYNFHALGPDGNYGANVVVTSDDCCDYQRITITETDGKFSLQSEPRVRSRRSADQYEAEESSSAPVPKRQCTGISSWEFWIGLSIF